MRRLERTGTASYLPSAEHCPENGKQPATWKAAGNPAKPSPSPFTPHAAPLRRRRRYWAAPNLCSSDTLAGVHAIVGEAVGHGLTARGHLQLRGAFIAAAYALHVAFGVTSVRAHAARLGVVAPLVRLRTVPLRRQMVPGACGLLSDSVVGRLRLPNEAGGTQASRAEPCRAVLV